MDTQHSPPVLLHLLMRFLRSLPIFTLPFAIFLGFFSLGFLLHFSAFFWGAWYFTTNQTLVDSRLLVFQDLFIAIFHSPPPPPVDHASSPKNEFGCVWGRKKIACSHFHLLSAGAGQEVVIWLVDPRVCSWVFTFGGGGGFLRTVEVGHWRWKPRPN